MVLIIVNALFLDVPAEQIFPRVISWWLVRVTLVVAFGFCSKISGGGRDLQMILLVRTIAECRDTQTLRPVKNCFELLTLPGGGDAKTFGR